ncbi:MAG: hypothetical protein CMH12_15145 [Maritimibacter sp.]|nr:hypothetical protein [Maritimibacter sp.]|tara:strand:+ start:151 stop:1110 length:960 start_codon:yes stop_codon:yes gene_type:complete
MILHLTNSAISGAAAMLADAQRAAGHDAACLQFGALKPEMMLFSPAAIPVNLSRPAGREILTTMLARATVVHVHNWLPRQIENLVLEHLAATGAQLVWQLHQGQREHPVYLADAPELKFDKKLVVAHGFARTYDDFIVVPNCLYRPSIPSLPHDAASEGGSLRVLYSPSSRTGTRWGAKRDESFDKLIGFMERAPFLSLTLAEGINPIELLALRTRHDVTIDEVVTGGFHLVSYEGLFTGNVVINNADILSTDIFCSALQTAEPPPFLQAGSDTLFDLLYDLDHDRARLERQKAAGRAYFEKYMNWRRIVSIYDDIYAA